jgi:hypothetical protein
MIDNKHGFIYIADSGIFSDPLEGGLLVFNIKTKALRRVLHQHESTQDVPGYWFEIAGKKVWHDKPMPNGGEWHCPVGRLKNAVLVPVYRPKLILHRNRAATGFQHAARGNRKGRENFRR